MKITISSTDKVTKIKGTEARAWTGRTDQGTACLVFVTAIAVVSGSPGDEELARELTELPIPTEVSAINLLRLLD